MDLRSLRYFVAVAEELHFGRAAARLHMSQPPLSRAIKLLETDLGHVLLHRSPAGVTLTPAGAALHDEARELLARAELIRTKLTAAAGGETVTIGTLADSAEQVGTGLVAAFRTRHPDLDVRIREGDLTDPTIGLRAGLVDVALTRTPFDVTGITVHRLRADPVGVVLRTDDPLAGRATLHPDELADRRWFRLPEGVDPVWRAFWTGPTGQDPDGPVVRTVNECLQSVLWSDSVGLTVVGHTLPDGLVVVPLAGVAPSCLVVAWAADNRSPLVRSFVLTAAAA
jgi:DNA-binding transcriptional LysR family regulator